MNTELSTNINGNKAVVKTTNRLEYFDLVYCYWCKQTIDTDEATTPAGAQQYGHTYCKRLAEQGLSNKAIRRQYLAGRAYAEKIGAW